MTTQEIVFLLLLLFVAVIAISLFFRLDRLKAQSATLIKENATLHASNALLEVEQLKFQLHPHTLNNLLSKLKIFASNLHRGMESLSTSLEYIMYKGNAHMVSVEDEIRFIESYLKLNDIFITEIDAIQLDQSGVNKNSVFYTNRCIPHLISAYFIENAFKHGDINHPEFLRVYVRLSDSCFEMKVINRNKRYPTPAKIGGIGIANMKKRLELLANGKYEISNTCDEHQYYSNLTIRF